MLRRTVHHDPAKGLEMVALALAPGTDTGPDRIHHDGPEYLLVTAGRLTVDCADTRHVLETGDGMRVDPGVLHRFGNDTTEPAEVILVPLTGTG